MSKDPKKWSFKLKLYENKADVAEKYYNEDAFCHEWCVTGYCTNRKQSCCDLDHNMPILLNDIASGNSHPDTLNFCRLLTHYFVYIYMGNNKHKKIEHSYTPFLQSFLAAFAAIDGNVVLSCKYFDQAVELANNMESRSSSASIFFNYARVLSQYCKNWKKLN